ncbi:MAG TPA: hypothetical protein VJY33_04880, partial [Isosphaeraceae bacterium]|nr:hypothetical protein [Isosphaeraceae bacterium]
MMGTDEKLLQKLYEEDQCIEQLKRLLTDSEHELEEMEERNQELEWTLADIQNSKSWNLVQRLAVGLGTVAPLGSRRRRVLQLGYRCLGAVPRLRDRRWVAHRARILLNGSRGTLGLAFRPYRTIGERLGLLVRHRPSLPSTPPHFP